MTASDRLKALDKAITDLSPFPDGRFVSEIHVKEPSAQSLVALRNALPQIVAMVKAAELLKTHGYGFHWNKKLGQDVCANITENCPLCAALAALDEALT